MITCMTNNMAACATDDDDGCDDDDGDDDDGDDDDGCGCSGAIENIEKTCADGAVCSECASDYNAFQGCVWQGLWNAFCPDDPCDLMSRCDAVSAGTRNGVVFALALTLLAPFALRF